MQRNPLHHLAAMVSGTACLALFLAATVAALPTAGAEALSEPVSKLALYSSSGFLEGTFLLAGTAWLALAGGLRAHLGGQARRAAIALGAGGLCIAMLAFFPVDPTVSPSTWRGYVHMAFAGSGFLLLTASIVSLARAFRQDGRWSRFAPHAGTWAFAVAAVYVGHVAIVTLESFFRPTRMVDGISERVLLGVVVAWTAVVVWNLRRATSQVPRSAR